MAKKVFNQVGKDFIVQSGSHYSGCVGYCSEVVKTKGAGVMLKLELSEEITWFKESEVKEF